MVLGFVHCRSLALPASSSSGGQPDGRLSSPSGSLLFPKPSPVDVLACTVRRRSRSASPPTLTLGLHNTHRRVLTILPLLSCLPVSIHGVVSRFLACTFDRIDFVQIEAQIGILFAAILHHPCVAAGPGGLAEMVPITALHSMDLEEARQNVKLLGTLFSIQYCVVIVPMPRLRFTV